MHALLLYFNYIYFLSKLSLIDYTVIILAIR